MAKLLIVAMLMLIAWALFGALFALAQPSIDRGQVVRRLTWRIGLSFALFVAILLSYFLGWVQPNPDYFAWEREMQKMQQK